MANFGDVVQEYYVSKFRKNAEIRQKRLRALDSKEAAQQYVDEVTPNVVEKSQKQITSDCTSDYQMVRPFH